jgi:hypothetical protein
MFGWPLLAPCSPLPSVETPVLLVPLQLSVSLARKHRE